MSRPFATFIENLGNDNINIVPVGFDAKHPIGTGPFKYHSFTPGQQSVFVKNPDYWQSPYPYIDTLTITDFSDPTAQLNALTANEVDAISYLPFTDGKSLPSGVRLLNARTGSYDAITMRVDLPPFNDVARATGLPFDDQSRTVRRSCLRQLRASGERRLLAVRP